jgi:RNA polymerase sigma-70 factor (ECF subfamily)
MIHSGGQQFLEEAGIGEIVELARSGDCDAFSELMRRYGSLIRRTAYGILKNSEDAEDAVQEAFLRVYTKFDTFQGTSAFRTWLTRIAINVCLMRLRQRRTRPFHSLEELTDGDDSSFLAVMDLAPDPEQRCATAELKERLQQAVRTLPGRLREVVEDQIHTDASVQELADRAGISTAAVKSRLYRARRMIAYSLTSRSDIPVSVSRVSTALSKSIQ